MQTHSVVPSPASESIQNNLLTSYNPNAKGVMGEIWKHHKRHVEIEELDDAIGQLNRSLNASSYQLLVLIRDGVLLMVLPGLNGGVIWALVLRGRSCVWRMR